MVHELLKSYQVILASASPRRQQLLTSIGVEYKVIVKAIDEIFPDEMEAALVPEFLSKQKMNAFEEVIQDNVLIITADTIVLHKNQIIGKPENAEGAYEMLKTLSGDEHTVITGVCLKSGNRLHAFSAQTSVWFRKFTDQEINYYIDTCQPFDKAGSYGIQEWIGYVGVEKIEGSFYNVMGLPTQQLYIEIEKFLRG